MNKNKILIAVTILATLFSVGCRTCSQEKAANQIIYASSVEHSPVIDGVLDDGCWKNVPFHSAFFYSCTNVPLADEDQIEMGVVYTENSLNIAIRAKLKHPLSAKGFFDEKSASVKSGEPQKFMPRFSMELYFSRTMTGTSQQMYQLLGDSFGGKLDRLSIFWNDFPGKYISCGKLDGEFWTFEFQVIPDKKISSGECWLFNAVVNEEKVPFAIRENVGTIFYIPSSISNMLFFGTQEEFADAVLKKYSIVEKQMIDAGLEEYPLLRAGKKALRAYQTCKSEANLLELNAYMERMNSILEYQDCKNAVHKQ